MAHKNIESLLQGDCSENFKSRGERKIANFLAGQKIDFRYEPAILVEDNQQKQRIWYPDFHLPEFGMFIEYFGVVNDPDYDKGVRFKSSIYDKMGMDVIGIYPNMFTANWQSYIIDKIGEKVQRQYNRFLSIPSLFSKDYNP